MIRVDVHVPKWDYNVKCFFAVSEYWVDEIMEELFFLQIDGSNAKRAYDNLTSGELNTGLCFANPREKEAVIVVAKTSSAAEFVNSVSHENHHLASYVAKQFGLEPTGEEVAFFAGELMKEQFPYIRHLMCDCCRKKVYHEREHGEDNGFGVRGQELHYYYE